ncbi:hypothetical protein M408DRAFT_108121 [Serendipita vermifera MAFF 305830]|uniref:Uncharacterized protein n=1 Tax=Serendipita vermifera MAFF 305830 TaxID=933852 RepID=A0A0C2XLF8_SERVB|nr:hypothetical protein M408DRAFT_108121 [Serendipita vermifera MAFF 305830]
MSRTLRRSASNEYRNSLPDYVSVYDLDLSEPTVTVPPPPVPAIPATVHTTPRSHEYAGGPQRTQHHHRTPQQAPVSNSQQTTKLLKMNYEQMSVLVLGSDKFEDIEQAAREMFQIPNTKPIFISTEVPSFNNERMTIHRAVWPVISNDISVIWIVPALQPSMSSSSTQPLIVRRHGPPPPPSRQIPRDPPSPLPSRQIPRGPPSPPPPLSPRSITIFVSENSDAVDRFIVTLSTGAKIRDLMTAIKAKAPTRWAAGDLVLNPAKGTEELATESSYTVDFRPTGSSSSRGV